MIAPRASPGMWTLRFRNGLRRPCTVIALISGQETTDDEQYPALLSERKWQRSSRVCYPMGFHRSGQEIPPGHLTATNHDLVDDQISHPLVLAGVTQIWSRSLHRGPKIVRMNFSGRGERRNENASEKAEVDQESLTEKMSDESDSICGDQRWDGGLAVTQTWTGEETIHNGTHEPETR